MKVIYIFFIVCVIKNAVSQDLIGFRFDEDSIYMDEINLESCTSKLTRSHQKPPSVGNFNSIFQAANLFFYNKKTKVIYYRHTDTIYVFDSYRKKAVDTIDWIITSPSTIDIFIKNNKVYLIEPGLIKIYSLPDLEIIDNVNLPTGAERFYPKASSFDFCTNFYIDFYRNTELFISNDPFGGFSNTKPYISIYKYINEIVLLGNRKQELISNVRDCYFPDLLYYDHMFGLYRININDASFSKICDLPYQYHNIYYIGDPIEEDCLPVIDLHDDECEWANEINNKDSISCFGQSEMILPDYPRILSPAPLDSIVVSLENIDNVEVEFVPIEFNGIISRLENNKITIINQGMETRFLEFFLDALRVSIKNGTPSSLDISFTPYLNENEGHVSNLSIQIKDRYMPAKFNSFSIREGESFTPDLYNDFDNSTYYWEPDAYLSCSDCPNPIITPYNDHIYYVEIESEFGCERVDTIEVKVIPNYPYIYVPNIINPNSHIPENRLFSIKGKNIDYYSLEVVNRNGQLIYSENYLDPDDQDGWDGRFNGESVTQGVYVYSIVVYPAFDFQGRIKKIGTVTVVY